ncbi:MAG: hypothetical protein AB8B74_11345 [Crocinitomicaceae bacterium]
MKNLSIIILVFIAAVSCKKEPSEKAFLYGRLIDGCNGKPVSGQTVQFYRNFKKGATIFELDTQTELLEEVSTDENGFFYFTGDEYTSKSTVSIGNSSVRLQKSTYLASGTLGKGDDAKEGDGTFLHNVGDVLFDGMPVDVNFKIETGGYDSVKVFNSFIGINMTLSEVQNNYFVGNLADIKLRVKNFWAN